MGNVHKLTDQCLLGEANADLVEAIELLLARAKSGEITSLAWAGWTGRDNDTIFNGWEGDGGSQFAMCASIAVMQSRFIGSMTE